MSTEQTNEAMDIDTAPVPETDELQVQLDAISDAITKLGNNSNSKIIQELEAILSNPRSDESALKVKESALYK